MPAKSMTPSRSRRSIVLSSMPIWSSGVMSAVMAPLEAFGSVSRQNGTSSTIDATVGLFRPMTLNWFFGRSCADAPNPTDTPSTIPASERRNMVFSCGFRVESLHAALERARHEPCADDGRINRTSGARAARPVVPRGTPMLQNGPA